MKAVAREQLPISLLFSSPISLAPALQRVYSSVKEPIRVLAVLIIFLVLLALSSSYYFSFIEIVNFSWSPFKNS